jgi:hypothetical protein
MGRSKLLVSGLRIVAFAVGLVWLLPGLTSAYAQTAPSLNAPPSLDLNQMMEALRQQQSQPARPGAEVGTTNIQPRQPTISGPARPTTPDLPQRLEAPVDGADARPEIDLPTSLMPFEDPTASPPAPAATADGDRDNTAEAILEQAASMASGDGLPKDIEAFAKMFGSDLGMNVTAPILQAQSLAVSFIDYLYRRDQPRIRALTGLPFYADDFMVDNERDLTRLMGPPMPITGQPPPVVEERRNDKLIGITIMQIAELRESEFYIGDRGADLLGLEDNDFYVRIVFQRTDRIVPMIVYVRRIAEDRFEIAGFFD